MFWMLIAGTILMGIIMAGVYMGYHLSNSILMRILSGVGVLILVGICVLPFDKEGLSNEQ